MFTSLNQTLKHIRIVSFMDASGLAQIYNFHSFSDQNVYDSFNGFIFSNDRRVLAKLLYRHILFEKVKHLPGDIVELGVFKGSGIATWCKLLNLFTPHTNKKVIGFDLFGTNLDLFSSFKSGSTMSTVLQRTVPQNLTLQAVHSNLSSANISESSYLLIEGDVCKTTKEFAAANPGFRISLLYFDLDLDEPTYESLVNLWDRVVPGGYVVFDEYDYHVFDESNAVDRFLKEKNIKWNLQSTNIYAPSCYLIKE